MKGLAQGSASPTNSRPGSQTEVTLSPIPSVPPVCVFQRTLLPSLGGGDASCPCCSCHVTSHALHIFCSLTVASVFQPLEHHLLEKSPGVLSNSETTGIACSAQHVVQSVVQLCQDTAGVRVEVSDGGQGGTRSFSSLASSMMSGSQ